MVMPRAFSSGAASIWSYALASPPNLAASTEVIAAVSVVLPWSTWPIVPTFTCGLVRSNLPFAISKSPGQRAVASVVFKVSGALSATGNGRRGTEDRLKLLAARGNDRVGHVLRSFGVVLELHRVRGTALRHRAQRGRVAEHLRQRDLGLDDL